jgi:hypothetical protein
MKPRPFNQKRGKTGSNVRRNPLPAHRSKVLDAETRALRTRVRAYVGDCRGLFSARQLGIAAAIIADARRERHRFDLRNRRDDVRRAAGKTELRTKLGRQLARALPRFRAWQKLTRAYLRDQRKLLKLTFADSASIELGQVLSADPVDPQQFSAPFPLYDQQVAIQGTGPVVTDASVVVPENGHMMNRFAFVHDGNAGFGADAWFQLHRMMFAAPSVACGVNYAVPQTGRLRLRAVLQNYVSTVLFSVTDSFGFSNGVLDIQQRLFFSIVRRDGSVIYLPTTLLRSGIDDWQAIDISSALSTLDNSTPYTLQATTEESLPTFETLRIFVGSEVFIGSDMNDMTSTVHAHVWWHLKQLTVDVQ